MKHSAITFCSSFLLLALTFQTAAFADGAEGNPSVRGVEDGSSKETSPQVLDKRLPPVFPGQEVTVNGRKMNVWSTAGEVPVSQPPEPWKKDERNLKNELHGAEVIVDRRRDQVGDGK